MGGGAVLGLIFKWRWSYKMFGNQCVLYISVKNNYLKTQKTGDFVLPKMCFCLCLLFGEHICSKTDPLWKHL